MSKGKPHRDIDTHIIPKLPLLFLFLSTLGDERTSQEIVLKQVHKLVLNRAFEKLVDFDNHLDNIEMDWTNPAVGPALENTKED